MTESEPLFTYHRAGLNFEVWPNRIEVQERGGFLGMGGKKTVILLRNVSDVKVEGMTKQVTIATNDGNKRKWQLGSDGPKAVDTIVSLL